MSNLKNTVGSLLSAVSMGAKALEDAMAVTSHAVRLIDKPLMAGDEYADGAIDVAKQWRAGQGARLQSARISNTLDLAEQMADLEKRAEDLGISIADLAA